MLVAEYGWELAAESFKVLFVGEGHLRVGKM